MDFYSKRLSSKKDQRSSLAGGEVGREEGLLSSLPGGGDGCLTRAEIPKGKESIT